MRLQLLKRAYGLTAILLTATAAIQLQQIPESPDLYTINSEVDFTTTSGDSGLVSVPPLIAGEPDGLACGTGTNKKKKLRRRQKNFCPENNLQPAPSSQEQSPAASPGTMTIPDTLPGIYTQEHTGHEKVGRFCPEIEYTAHLCCDGPIGPFELTSSIIHLKYVDFCQGLGLALICPKEWDVCCKLHDTLNLLSTPGISCVPAVPVGV